MTIDDAIQELNELKAAGTRSIMMITMTHDNFGMEDDEAWGDLATLGENDIRVLDSVTDAIEAIREEDEDFIDEDEE